jgi:hypothetical protein
MRDRTWLSQRAAGVRAALSKLLSVAEDTAWAAVTIGFFVVYPFALSIVEDRVIGSF